MIDNKMYKLIIDEYVRRKRVSIPLSYYSLTANFVYRRVGNIELSDDLDFIFFNIYHVIL